MKRVVPLALAKRLKSKSLLLAALVVSAVVFSGSIVAASLIHSRAGVEDVRTSDAPKQPIKSSVDEEVGTASTAVDDTSVAETQQKATSTQSPSASRASRSTVTPPATPPAPQPFGLAGISLGYANACLNEYGGTLLNIADISASFTSNSGGTLYYWLETPGLSNMENTHYHFAVTVPQGMWTTASVRSLTPGNMGPGLLYSEQIATYQGSGSVYVTLEAGGKQFSTQHIAIPATAPCL